MRYKDDLEELERRHLIASIDDDSDTFLSPPSFTKKRRGVANPSYMVPVDVFNAIKAGGPYRYTVYCNLSPEEFFAAADSILTPFLHNSLGVTQLRNEICYLFNGNRDNTFVKAVKELKLGFQCDMILLTFCAAMLEDNAYSLRIKTIRNLFRNSRASIMRFKSGEHPLFCQGLLEHACDEGMVDTEEYCLTNKARALLLSDVDLKERTQRRGGNFITADGIAEKELSYSERLRARVAELTSLLKEENFALVKERLRERNMRTGFTCLFSGSPGTGKIETAYQIARKTERDIMLVDISDTKSMWFGESEKKIKAVFDRYQGLVKHSPIAPILLFNEADAVLGKRMELGEDRRGPGQTENAMQNIILQEMENLSGGILIATTNMTGNLDKAFERRFLYKIEFEKPDAAAKRAIWKSIIPSL
ncbi:MAG: ATP-binding protein [Treponema sp.]|nr:ATP-binding protein [Treponema sp.]